jgi:large subunit ribosomal protein L24e
VTKSQKSQGKGAVQKGSKGPKLGGGGGKRWKSIAP